MSDEQRIDPKHLGARRVLRVIGPIALVIGLLFTVVGVGSFIASATKAMSGFGHAEGPKYFWCAFVGVPLLFVGGALTALGFLGAFARYQAAEIAPVGKDTFNYLADGTKGGVKTVARAIGEGLSSGLAGGAGRDGSASAVRCQKCNTENDADARFCDNCGAELIRSSDCPKCGETNDAGARFCDNCGARLQ